MTVPIQCASARLASFSPLCIYQLKHFKDMESNPDWNMCIDHNGMRMGRCVHACNGNEACELDCLAGFKSRQKDCPCEVSIFSVISMIHTV